jgi:hypothetical protein
VLDHIPSRMACRESRISSMPTGIPSSRPHYASAARPERLSDHDPPVVFRPRRSSADANGHLTPTRTATPRSRGDRSPPASERARRLPMPCPSMRPVRPGISEPGFLGVVLILSKTERRGPESVRCADFASWRSWASQEATTVVANPRMRRVSTCDHGRARPANEDMWGSTASAARFVSMTVGEAQPALVCAP